MAIDLVSLIKQFLTPEMVQRNEMPSQRGDCRTTAQARSGNKMSMAFACSNPPSQGEGQVTIDSPEAYTSRMTVTTTVQGKPQKVNMESSGKWLAADSGTRRHPALDPGSRRAHRGVIADVIRDPVERNAASSRT